MVFFLISLTYLYYGTAHLLALDIGHYHVWQDKGVRGVRPCEDQWQQQVDFQTECFIFDPMPKSLNLTPSLSRRSLASLRRTGSCPHCVHGLPHQVGSLIKAKLSCVLYGHNVLDQQHFP